ncbi:Vitamin B12-binding protein precursor [compost metagenome]
MTFTSQAIHDEAERVLAQVAVPKRPKRIVCLTEETVEVLYRLGAGDLVAGVSIYVRRPPEARQKPRVSAFIKADFAKIEALQPDLVLCFSDLQAEIAAECVRRGLEVVVFNQRSVSEILGVVLALGALVGRESAAAALADELTENLRAAARRAASWSRRPRVYFEEWPDPMISGIRWVSELVTIAGGEDLFSELSHGKLAKERFVDPAEVVRRQPELILASWCGKRVKRDQILGRTGWEEVPAIRDGEVHEISSTLILQPGPAALSDGLFEVQRHIERLATRA